MNDGEYKPFDQAVFDTYAHGYRHIVERLQTELPGVRLTLIQPSAFDDVTRPESVAGGYNAVLRRYSGLRRLACKGARRARGRFQRRTRPGARAVEPGRTRSSRGRSCPIASTQRPRDTGSWRKRSCGPGMRPQPSVPSPSMPRARGSSPRTRPPSRASPPRRAGSRGRRRMPRCPSRSGSTTARWSSLRRPAGISPLSIAR